MTRLEARESIDAQFERILRDRDVRTVFQPVVDLPAHAVVGYEALVRGPEGSALADAGSLVSAAHRAGRLEEFDWVARASACRAALAAELDTDYVLLLNVEPITLGSECPSDLWPDIEQAFRAYRVVLEVTERSLDRDPGRLLDGVERQRPLVAGIGLDDVGSHPATVAMLPLVGPDVISIDRTVVQDAPNPEVTRVLNAVHAEVERTGAIVLAEGVETVEHRRNALAQGARIGQGRFFGEPKPLPVLAERLRQPAPLSRRPPMIVATPFDALAGQVDGTVGDDVVLELTRRLAAYADASEPALYVSLLPAPYLLQEADLRRLARLARAKTFAAVLGPDLPAEPGQGVRGTGQGREPIPRDEWAAIVVGPRLNAAVLARRAPDRYSDWMYGVTYDPTSVIAAARSLVRLLGPPDPYAHREG